MLTPIQLDRLVGMAMLIVATTVFLYYTAWTLLMVCMLLSIPELWLTHPTSPLLMKITTYSASSLHVSGLFEYPSSSLY